MFDRHLERSEASTLDAYTDMSRSALNDLGKGNLKYSLEQAC
jgi:hypothetical protein